MLTKNLILLSGYLLLFLSQSVAANHLEYWSLQEYLTLHPEQQALSKAFAKRVRQEVQPSTKKLAKPLRIALLTPDQQVSDYWSRNQQSLSKRLTELGVSFSLQNYSSLPATHTREQEQLLANALQSDPDYLILTLNTAREAILLDKLLTRDKPKIIVMNITTPLKHLGAKQPFFYVGFDHEQGTQLLQRKMKEMTGGQANYLMLYGTRGYISRVRGDSFIQLNQKEDNISLSQAFYTDVKPEKTKQAIFEALTAKPNINLIYACTTDIALAAAKALKAMGKQENTIINGWGGGSDELAALVAGELDLTVMRMNDDNGIAIAEAIMLDQLGKKEAVPQVYNGDFVLIDQHTSPAALERFKSHAFRYSN
ncbi:substrate-binding domain-containing protein [Oceanisphaera avium]|uniref:Sugar ABC transporter substrate-binding protein n=1 Tax=Oceanisphaera avium TaxID=1903694 RepID=A0A1Y0D0P8_9GAMM|nr:substrate-binding domain-containing protein [Oceanisphaera avium]ART81171.1 sugar ABC transporter substrate-binding protein [Oceanisphaera avium]